MAYQVSRTFKIFTNLLFGTQYYLKLWPIPAQSGCISVFQYPLTLHSIIAPGLLKRFPILAASYLFSVKYIPGPSLPTLLGLKLLLFIFSAFYFVVPWYKIFY
jgi:hypothetical protein